MGRRYELWPIDHNLSVFLSVWCNTIVLASLRLKILRICRELHELLDYAKKKYQIKLNQFNQLDNCNLSDIIVDIIRTCCQRVLESSLFNYFPSMMVCIYDIKSLTSLYHHHYLSFFVLQVVFHIPLMIVCIHEIIMFDNKNALNCARPKILEVIPSFPFFILIIIKDNDKDVEIIVYRAPLFSSL